MKIRSARLHPYCLRLRSPIATARERLVERRGFLLELEADDGHVGWGDACPIAGFAMEDLTRCAAGLADIGRSAIGADPSNQAGALRARAEAIACDAPGAAGAFDVALGDLAARIEGVSWSQQLVPEGVDGPAETLEVSALVVGDGPASVATSAGAQVEQGFCTFKLKVAGASLEADLARVRALRDVIGPGARLRLDANGGWSEGEARVALAALEGFDIELIEQPVPAADVAALARLRAIGAVPIAADEAVASAEDAARVLEAGAADVIVLKPAALGGPTRALAIGRAAKEAGCAVIVTSLLDSALGVAAAVHCAAALPVGRPADGLATGGLFDADVAKGPTIVRGRLRRPAGPGLGVVPSEDSLHAVRCGPMRDLGG